MNDEFRQLLEAGDVDALRKAWHRVASKLPQPVTRGDAEFMMHYARTQASSVSPRSREYSHRWLTERSMPSALPQDMRPKIVEAVGVSVNFTSPHLAPAAEMVLKAINNSIEECYADGDTDPGIVSVRMAEAKDREMKALFGGIGR